MAACTIVAHSRGLGADHKVNSPITIFLDDKLSDVKYIYIYIYFFYFNEFSSV